MALTPEDVVNKRFQPTKFREGYDQDEVDDFLDEIVVELRRLNQENDELRKKLAELGAGTPASSTPRRPWSRRCRLPSRPSKDDAAPRQKPKQRLPEADKKKEAEPLPPAAPAPAAPSPATPAVRVRSRPARHGAADARQARRRRRAAAGQDHCRGTDRSQQPCQRRAGKVPQDPRCPRAAALAFWNARWSSSAASSATTAPA